MLKEIAEKIQEKMPEKIAKEMPEGIAKSIGKALSLGIRISSPMRLGLFIFFMAMLSIWPGNAPLQARVTCYGSDCADTGLNFDQINSHLEQIYLKNLSQDFASSTAISNIALPYNGSVNLNLLTVGVQSAIGLKPSSSGDIAEMTDAEVNNARSGGFGLNSSIFMGFNLGNVINWFGLINGVLLAPKFLALDRFDFMYGLANYSLELEDEARIDDWEMSFNSVYYEIRYQIVGSRSPLGLLFSWQGLSMRLGFIETKRSITANDRDRSGTNYLELGDFDWVGMTELKIRQSIRTIPIEFNSGLRLLHYFTFTLGVGGAFYNGSSVIDFQRESIIGLRMPEITSNAFIVADLQGEEEVDEFIPYAKAGFEIQLIPFTAIGGEAILSENGLHAFSLGVRADI